MKKYRLIEFDISHQKGVRLEAKYNSLEQVVDALTILLGNNSESFYRIEEVEESIMDRVKSYEDACDVTGRLNADTDKEHWAYISPAHIAALEKLETLTAALNEGWKPDWEDKDQDKWTVVFTENFSTAARKINNNLYHLTAVPSRLLFKSKELAEYAAKQFKELYEQLLVERF